MTGSWLHICLSDTELLLCYSNFPETHSYPFIATPSTMPFLEMAAFHLRTDKSHIFLLPTRICLCKSLLDKISCLSEALSQPSFRSVASSLWPFSLSSSPHSWVCTPPAAPRPLLTRSCSSSLRLVVALTCSQRCLLLMVWVTAAWLPSLCSCRRNFWFIFELSEYPDVPNGPAPSISCLTSSTLGDPCGITS